MNENHSERMNKQVILLHKIAFHVAQCQERLVTKQTWDDTLETNTIMALAWHL